MDDLGTRTRSTLSHAEINRRREAVSHAFANARLEGQFLSPESEALFDRFIQGEFEIGELIERLKVKDGLR
jgi:hypothetical protein